MQNKEKNAVISSELRGSALAILVVSELFLGGMFLLFLILTASLDDSLIPIFVSLMFVFFLLMLLPLIAFLIDRRTRQLTSLTVKEKEIVGSYTGFIPIEKISLRMPIEKIDNVVAANSIFDTYTGKRICISSTSGRIKIPFVLNADEMVAFIAAMIEKARNGYGSPVEVSHERPQDNPAETLKKFADLRDAGIITEEEFNQKKQELLKLM